MSDDPAEEQSSFDVLLAEMARAPSELPRGDAEPSPTRVGHFRIEGLLGRGGMGIVYRAFDESLQREIALKVLPGLREHDGERRRRLLREARAAAAVTHPNIAAVYEVGETDGRLYIALELVRGETLRARLRRGRLDVEVALELAAQLARGLSRAHAANIVHRDLKPENVLVDEGGTVKILDFGLAKLVHPEARTPSELGALETVTHEGRVLGTPVYMAPEQARGDEVTPAADVFSFGVMLHEMVTGKRPFGGASQTDLLLAMETDAPPRASSQNPDVPRALDAFLGRCLAHDPARRPRDGDALVGELARIKPARRWQRVVPRRSGWAMGAAGVLALGIGLAAARRAPSRHTLMTDLQLPPSAIPAAVAAYRTGIQSLRDASGAGFSSFTRATELDPSMSAAWLRRFRSSTAREPGTRRDLYTQAAQNRAGLDARDMAILEAYEPAVLQEPPDRAGSVARLAKLVAAYPDDEDLLVTLAHEQILAVDDVAADATADRAIALGNSPRAWATKGLARVQLMDRAGAEAAWQHGLAVYSGCSACLYNLMWLEATSGECPQMEATARLMTRVNPQDVDGYWALAWALSGQGAPRAAEVEAWTQTWKPPLNGDSPPHADTTPVDLLHGDFAIVEERLPEMDRLHAAEVDESGHADIALVRLALAEEAGDTARAGQVAREFLDRRGVWTKEGFYDELPLINDPAPLMLAAATRARLITPAAAKEQTAAWIAEWRAKTPANKTGYLWLYGLLVPAETPEDARAALDAAPQFAPLPLPVKFTWFGPVYEAHVGKALLLAGRPQEALESLTRAAAGCDDLEFPVEKVRAKLWLGQAREASGDVPGACAAYGQVLARWGAAAERSVTARTAGERAKALGCPR